MNRQLLMNKAYSIMIHMREKFLEKSKHFTVGKFCFVNRDLTGNNLDMEEHGDKVMIKKSQLVRVREPATIEGWVGVDFPRSLTKWTPVDIPEEALTPLGIKSIFTIAIPHAIANIHLGRK